MIYGICFILAILIFLHLIINVKNMDVNLIVLNMVVVVGNGGYYALSEAQNLNEAILANKITYITGCFTPMIMFLVLCDICKVIVKNRVKVMLYSIQVIIYLFVCFSNKNTLFYKTVDFVQSDAGGHLVKSYGIVHTIYIVTLCVYMLLCIFIVGVSVVKKRHKASAANTKALLILYLSAIVLYFTERFADIDFELMPIVFAVTDFFVTFIFIKITKFSAYSNPSIADQINQETAYIIFNKKLIYMSSNDYALTLFPELSDWEIGKKIPGNGGRFNTFLRIDFMNFVNDGSKSRMISSFNLADVSYRAEFDNLYFDGKNSKGYAIKITRKEES